MAAATTTTLRQSLSPKSSPQPGSTFSQAKLTTTDTHRRWMEISNTTTSGIDDRQGIAPTVFPHRRVGQFAGQIDESTISSRFGLSHNEFSSKVAQIAAKFEEQSRAIRDRPQPPPPAALTTPRQHHHNPDDSQGGAEGEDSPTDGPDSSLVTHTDKSSACIETQDVESQTDSLPPTCDTTPITTPIPRPCISLSLCPPSNGLFIAPRSTVDRSTTTGPIPAAIVTTTSCDTKDLDEVEAAQKNAVMSELERLHKELAELEDEYRHKCEAHDTELKEKLDDTEKVSRERARRHSESVSQGVSALREQLVSEQKKSVDLGKKVMAITEHIADLERQLEESTDDTIQTKKLLHREKRRLRAALSRIEGCEKRADEKKNEAEQWRNRYREAIDQLEIQRVNFEKEVNSLYWKTVQEYEASIAAELEKMQTLLESEKQARVRDTSVSTWHSTLMFQVALIIAALIIYVIAT